ncbi:hypothetical protein HELRODRAFT_173827 [Helobdella robusta]|uniref:Uncharacterized protein n=1 Tax=Helobdella robusta TaxID=6412 RepID=T1F7A5_HELRO|nr:hypothetical protein HELRODRAFT_173827 [Helobdella robusta]ESO02992.1 hypothetical protein HELRODRAFT_173827 [Helobdella robusta]
MNFENRWVLKSALNFASDGEVVREVGRKFQRKGSEKAKADLAKELQVYQLSVIIRYVQKSETSYKAFSAFLPNVGQKSQDLFNAVSCFFLQSNNLDLQNCRGKFYDNASNITKKYSGLQAHIKEFKHQLNTLEHKEEADSNLCIRSNIYFSFAVCSDTSLDEALCRLAIFYLPSCRPILERISGGHLQCGQCYATV